MKKHDLLLLFLVLSVIGIWSFALWQWNTKPEAQPPPETISPLEKNESPITENPPIENEEKPTNSPEAPIEKTMGTYEKKRYFYSDVHIYTSGIGETLAVSTGTPKLETLETLTIPNAVAKVNLGMFDSWFQHGGMYIVDGQYIQEPMARYIDLVIDKKGKMDVQSFKPPLDNETVHRLQEETQFVVGTTYSLVQDGVENLENAALYSHYNTRQPRTLFGQRADGRYVLVVVDGRKIASVGVTASQSAKIMLDLGCVEAVNLDGGGSSSMWVQGELKSSPSDGKERAIGSALFVIHE